MSDINDPNSETNPESLPGGGNHNAKIPVDPWDAIYGSPEMLMQQRELLTIPEVCYILHIWPTIFSKLNKIEKLVPKKMGHCVRYRTSDVRAYLAAI